MTLTSETVRAWQGPAIFSYGFRPFFLGGAAWAVAAMALWIAILTGSLSVPTAFDSVSWHAHEFLFGYLGAVIAGFMMTAVPNWTGRPPIVGWQLAVLFALWVAGRVAIVISAHLTPWLVALIDLSFGTVLMLSMAREVTAGRNWRNIIVIGMLAVFVFGNGIFHWDAARGDYAASGFGLRVGLGASVMLIAIIGGRIIPAFTRNWLVQKGAGRLPAPPMQRLDTGALLVLLAALLAWAALPRSEVTAYLLLVSGALHLVRLSRWCGLATRVEPLVLVLHAAYLFVPLGALAMGAEILLPGLLGIASAQHLWMGGAIGLMTLAVMSRATLGHTGRPLAAGAATVAMYFALVIAVMARVAAGIWPVAAAGLHAVSGTMWIAAFSGFCVIYGPLLWLPRATAGD